MSSRVAERSNHSRTRLSTPVLVLIVKFPSASPSSMVYCIILFGYVSRSRAWKYKYYPWKIRTCLVISAAAHFTHNFHIETFAQCSHQMLEFFPEKPSNEDKYCNSIEFHRFLSVRQFVYTSPCNIPVNESCTILKVIGFFALNTFLVTNWCASLYHWWITYWFTYSVKPSTKTDAPVVITQKSSVVYTTAFSSAHFPRRDRKFPQQCKRASRFPRCSHDELSSSES